MRLLKRVRNPEGHTEVKVLVSTADDLWHLFNLIAERDRVTTKTKRKVQKETQLGAGQAQVKTVVLEIEVRNVDFDPTELRLQGVNKSNNSIVKLNAFHTLTIDCDPPQEVLLVKSEWDAILEQRLQEACNQEGKADTAAVTLDLTGNALVTLVTPSLVYTKARITVTIGKKHKSNGSTRDKNIQKFFGHVLDAMVAHIDFEKVKVVLICSPGNVREEFKAFILSQAVKGEGTPVRALLTHQNKIVLVKTNSSNQSAIREALSDVGISKKAEITKCSDDIHVWESFQSKMNHDPDRCVYTPQPVFEACLKGAVDNLMLSDALLRSSDPIVRRFYAALVQQVKAAGGSANIFSSRHVTGEQLLMMGGAAAILRFPCPELDALPVNPDFIFGDDARELIVEYGASVAATV